MASDGPPLTLLGWKVTAVTLPGSSEGVLFTPKAKHWRAEWWACLATPTRLPRILAGRQRAQDQGSPLHKYRRGRGSSRGLPQRLSSRRNSFQGNVSLSLSTEEPSLSALQPGWTLDRRTSFLNAVCFVLVLHLRAQTLLWEDQAGSAHT